MSRDYIEVKIDTDRMTHGKKVAERLRRSQRGGIPWMVILDSKGNALITSDGPGGNVGCPVRPAERAHFIHMLKETAQRMSEEDIASVKKSLDTFAEKILAKRD